MMSDHWKAIARLLGAAGAADPAAQAAKGAAEADKTAMPKSGESAAVPVNSVPSARNDESKKEARAKGKPAANVGQFGGGLLSGEGAAEADDADLRAEVSSKSPVSSFADVIEEKTTSEVDARNDDDLLNFSSFNSSDDEREKPARRLFGTQKGQGGASEKKAADAEIAADAKAKPEVEAPRGLDRIFGEPEGTNEPSSWDKLVDRLGVEAPEELRSETTGGSLGRGRPVDEPRSARPKDDVRKSAGGPVGFGSGLGLDLPDDDVEPEQVEAPRSRSEAPRPGRGESRRSSGRSATADSGRVDSSSPVRAEVEKDPLEELGGDGWGQPKRGRNAKSADNLPEASGTSGSEIKELVEDSDSDRPEETTARRGERGRGRGGARGEDRGESGSDTGRRESRGPSRGSREDVGNRDRDDVVDSTAGAPTSESKGGGEVSSEAGGRSRRGRRGQRQKMGEDLTGSVEFEKRGPARRQEVELDEDDFESSEDPMDGAISRSVDDDEPEGPTRRRRRRGRRRRSGTDSEVAGGEERSDEIESGEELVGDEREESPTGRAIDAEFDDDHEDDEEAVALRRSRRRRRRGVEPAEAKEVAFGELDVVDSVADDEAEDDDQEAVSYNVQRNVPTWLNAVEILVNSNMDARKRDPKRSGGGSSNGGGGRNRPRR